MNLNVPIDETPMDIVTQTSGGSKHHKREINGRPGRLQKAEKLYHKTKTHTGKGKTLRSHRRSNSAP